jgi:glutaryl-CoA dehydrogenase
MVADITQSLGTDFYLMDELLTEEERRIRDKVRAFSDQEVIPIINDYWERAEFPFELIPKLAALNIAGAWVTTTGPYHLDCHSRSRSSVHGDGASSSQSQGT